MSRALSHPAAVELDQVQRFIDLLAEKDETTILRGFVGWVRENGWV